MYVYVTAVKDSVGTFIQQGCVVCVQFIFVCR